MDHTLEQAVVLEKYDRDVTPPLHRHRFTSTRRLRPDASAVSPSSQMRRVVMMLQKNEVAKTFTHWATWTANVARDEKQITYLLYRACAGWRRRNLLAAFRSLLAVSTRRTLRSHIKTSTVGRLTRCWRRAPLTPYLSRQLLHPPNLTLPPPITLLLRCHAWSRVWATGDIEASPW